MNKKEGKKAINALQNDDDYVVLNNPLSSPKFIRTIGKGQNRKEISTTETYTPKVFYEIVSRLTPEHLEGIKKTESIKFDINIQQFLGEIGANKKNFRHLIDSVDALQSTLLKWKEGNEIITVAIITKSIHNDKTGIIELYVDSDLAKRVLEVKEKENFSFLKNNIFRLQNAQAIKLYPFFKSWANYGKGYEIDLERFKNDFGYNTSGYSRYGNIEKYILKPALEEINEKTDILITYKVVGVNLESKRPRIKGLVFCIKAKIKDKKQLPLGKQNQMSPPKDKQTHISNVIQTVVAKKETPKFKYEQKQGTISEADLIALSKKINLTSEQFETIRKRLRDDYIRIFEVLQGCLNQIKNGIKVKSSFAYILKGIDTLGVGMYAQEQENAQKIRSERIEKEKQILIEKIKKEYKDRKEIQFLKLYENTTDQEKAKYFEHIKENHTIKTNLGNRNYYISNNKLNKDGQVTVGELLAEQNNTGKEVRQQKYRNEVLEKYSYQIDYDENDQVIIEVLITFGR